jgi:PhzF family phenazine biosynthesis protein
MTLPLFLVDAFADQPFTGNPAAVCLLSSLNDSAWMQQVASEMAQAETAFVSPRGEDWDLRWFTPQSEVDLCGHATLAAAHVLQQSGRCQVDRPIRFHTRSGLLTATPHVHDIELDFPAVTLKAMSPPEALIPALGVQPLAVFSAGPDIVVELLDAEMVKGLTPDLEQLRFCAQRGVGVMAAGSGNADVVSRFFAPAVGIPEDAVTGSLHCALGPYWARRLKRNRLRCFQASQRGGWITLQVGAERVGLIGQARIVVTGVWQDGPRT